MPSWRSKSVFMSRIAERALEDIVRRRLAGIVVRHSRFKSWVREIVKDVHRVEVIDKTDRATRWIGLRCEDEAAADRFWIAFAKTESLLSIGRPNCLPMSIHREASTRLFVCAAPQFSSLDQSGLAAARTTCRDLLTMRKPLAKAGACGDTPVTQAEAYPLLAHSGPVERRASCPLLG